MCCLKKKFLYSLSVFPNTPSSWSLDGENREQMTYMPASTGGVIMPPVPPRSFPPGTVSFYFTVMLIEDFRESVWLGYYSSLSIMIWTLWAFIFLFLFLT